MHYAAELTKNRMKRILPGPLLASMLNDGLTAFATYCVAKEITDKKKADIISGLLNVQMRGIP
jgi:hypothetical protein